jgi:hypothetical protein
MDYKIAPQEDNGLTYVIFDVTELDKIDFSQVLQTSAETCRLSVDKTKTLVKWYTAYEVPPSVESLTTKSQYYTHEEILQIMSTTEWTKPMPV